MGDLPTFVALDLETTGLSPTKDTIIEVAAVKFSLERDGNIFRSVNVEERTMLIDPEREISEQISMITGISNVMVRGKSKWKEVRDRVAEFIGKESIIVGHNVLFDIGMLRSHGIDLSSHATLDTFELSELFSGDAESLNLGFLAKHLGIDMESEHRALDDTKLSVQLFLHYLGHLSEMHHLKKSLWRYARLRDESGSIDTLLTLIGDGETSTNLDMSIFQEECDIPVQKWGKKSKNPLSYETIDLSPDWKEEYSLIRRAREKGKVLIVTSSKKQSAWLEAQLSPLRVVQHIDTTEYLSLKILRALLERPVWGRKETILLLRLMNWLVSTETGRIDELKWYGEENKYKELLRANKDEWTKFRGKNEMAKNEADIVIIEGYHSDTREPVWEGYTTLIVRDILELDASLRFRESISISWHDLYRYVDSIYQGNPDAKEHLTTALSTIEEVAKGVPHRPTGPNISPPGEYGETYFYTQQDFWHQGHIWLIWAMEEIEKVIYQTQETHDIISDRYLTLLKEQIAYLSRLIHRGDTNLGLILTIKEDMTTLRIIPRQMTGCIKSFLLTHSGDDTTILSGYNITTPYLREYLEEECGIIVNAEGNRSGAYSVRVGGEIKIEYKKTVVLGTNLKTLRAIKEHISRMSHAPIYTQGISGGKGKMRTLFEKEDEAILIGLIDTWKDDSTFWKCVDSLFITKIPFDPPSDPYYLARTSGISNNFENYSLPMAIHTLSTLIGRARSANPNINITITDEKLQMMAWGQSVRDALKLDL